MNEDICGQYVIEAEQQECWLIAKRALFNLNVFSRIIRFCKKLSHRYVPILHLYWILL
eukprot:UN28899